MGALNRIMGWLYRATSFVQSPLYTILALTGLCGIAFVFFQWSAIFGPFFHSPFFGRWIWEIVAALGAVLVFVVFFWGIPRFREYSFVHRQTSEYQIGEQQSPEEFHAKFVQALSKFKHRPGRAGQGDALYSLPWYVMIGAGQCGKTAALAAADVFLPFTNLPKEGGTQNCDWWASNEMMVLDTAGRYSIPQDAERDRADWYRLLQHIRYYHPREPISGLIVAVAASDILTKPPEALRTEATQVRERIEEAIDELRIDFPVYLLITKCDLLEGFVPFFNVMPPRILNEACGWTDNAPTGDAAGRTRGSEAIDRFRAGVHSIYDRLHLLRQSILNSVIPEQLRQSIFSFPEEFRALEALLMAFAEPLLSEHPKYHTPLFRGLFLSSSRQEGKPLSSLRRQLKIVGEPPAFDMKVQTHYFLRDLFTTMVPRDRSLATTDAQAKQTA